jgi:hypothetical protein
MAAVVIPFDPGDRLFQDFKIEVPVIPFAAQTLVRVSMQRHVRPGDVPALTSALRQLSQSRTC